MRCLSTLVARGARQWLVSCLLVAACTAGAVSRAAAAAITWGAPTNIAGDTDVSTAGTLVGAFNVGEVAVPAATVNGVAFQPFAVPSGSSAAAVGNFALATGSTFVSSNNLFGFNGAPFNTLSPAYQALLESGVIVSQNSFTLTMSGLTVGAQYQFQWWANFSTQLPASWTATAGNTVTLDSNVQNIASGGTGQFAIGQFTADAGSEVITFSGANGGLLNGFQLRQTAPAPTFVVPLPAGAYAGVLTVALVAVLRRRVRHPSQA